jgi:Zn-dependent peptidase ImmA (M78 family)/transcriptional regulator with XRE-family HTH domain
MEQILNSFNADMLAIARDFRLISQADLAERAGVGQSFISQLEGGVLRSCATETIEKIADVLQFPSDFFFLKGERLGFGSSALFYRGNGRKLKNLKLSETRHVSSRVNLYRLALKRLLDAVEIDSQIKLQRASEGMTPKQAAQFIRAVWSLPSGPIPNLTSLIERSGIIIIECDFQDVIAGTTIVYSDMAPVIFVEKNLNAERLRFTLAHELGHIMLHDVPSETMEDEADEFASELLLDGLEFFSMTKPMGQRPKLRQLNSLKPYWKVSVQAIIERLYRSGNIQPEWRRSLYTMISSYGLREELIPFPKESASLWPTIVREAVGLESSEVQSLLRLPIDAVTELFSFLNSAESPKRQTLRLV